MTVIVKVMKVSRWRWGDDDDNDDDNDNDNDDTDNDNDNDNDDNDNDNDNDNHNDNDDNDNDNDNDFVDDFDDVGCKFTKSFKLNISLGSFSVRCESFQLASDSDGLGSA